MNHAREHRTATLGPLVRSYKATNIQNESLLTFSMPFINVSSSTGNIKFHYTISTPNCNNADKLDPDYPVLLFFHAFAFSNVFHCTLFFRPERGVRLIGTVTIISSIRGSVVEKVQPHCVRSQMAWVHRMRHTSTTLRARRGSRRCNGIHGQL